VLYTAVHHDLKQIKIIYLHCHLTLNSYNILHWNWKHVVFWVLWIGNNLITKTERRKRSSRKLTISTNLTIRKIIIKELFSNFTKVTNHPRVRGVDRFPKKFCNFAHFLFLDAVVAWLREDFLNSNGGHLIFCN